MAAGSRRHAVLAGAVAGATALWRAVARAGAAVRWYLRELSGESAYDKYLAHHGRAHPGEQPLSAATFWRSRADEEARSPQTRCC